MGFYFLQNTLHNKHDDEFRRKCFVATISRVYTTKSKKYVSKLMLFWNDNNHPDFNLTMSYKSKGKTSEM